VAGAAALYLETDPTPTPAEVAQAVLGLATQNRVSGAGAGSPNRLLHSLFAGGTPADLTPPQTSITAPASGATTSGTVTVSANATDASGISVVEFYVDGVKKGTDTTSAYTYAWDTTTAANGAHALVSKAFDPSNNMGSARYRDGQQRGRSANSIVNGAFEGTSSPWAFTGSGLDDRVLRPHRHRLCLVGGRRGSAGASRRRRPFRDRRHLLSSGCPSPRATRPQQRLTSSPSRSSRTVVKVPPPSAT
jgi:hypothetical protein